MAFSERNQGECGSCHELQLWATSAAKRQKGPKANNVDSQGASRGAQELKAKTNDTVSLKKLYMQNRRSCCGKIKSHS